MDTLSLSIPMLAFPFLLAYSAISDLTTMRLPNWLSLALIVLLFLCAVPAGLSWSLIGAHASLSAIVLVCGFVLFAFRIIGGGDAKLCAALALWIGPDQIYPFFIYAALLGGALTLALMVFRRIPLPGFAESQAWIKHLHTATTGVPYGIALAAAALLVYPETTLFQAL